MATIGYKFSVLMEFVDGFWLPSVGLVTYWHFYMRHHAIDGRLVRTEPTPSAQNIVISGVAECDAPVFLEALRDQWQDDDMPPCPDFAVN